MEVEDASEKRIRTVNDRVMSFSEWQAWFRQFNAKKLGSTWDVLKTIADRAEWKLPGWNGMVL